MFGALVLRSRLTRIAPTTPLGFVLRHFRSVWPPPGREESWIHLKVHLTFSQIRDLDLWILRSGEMSGCLAGIFTAPQPRWWSYTLENASGLSRRLLWGLCWPNESAERAHRSCCIKNGFWNMFFVKSMHFLVTNFSSRVDLEGSEGWDKKSAQFNLFYGHSNT